MALIITAFATVVLAIVTGIYAIIARKTLRQLETTTKLTTLPKLMLDHFVYSTPWPSGVSVYIKNAGFGPALNISPELSTGPNGLIISKISRDLGAGDTFDLSIYAKPKDRDLISSVPIFHVERIIPLDSSGGA